MPDGLVHRLQSASCNDVWQPMKGTIKSKQDVERLFRTGRRSSSSLMAILSIKGDTSISGRCAFVAGKKLGCAPLRNRCKRVLRQAACELGAPWKGCDVVFIAHTKVARAPHEEVVRQMRNNLERLGVLQ